MNKIKFALVSLALVLGFTACNKNDYEYEPGKATSNNKALYFDDEENVTMALTDNEVTITLNRVDTVSGLPELTVPLIVNSAPDFVTVPKSVTFAAGKDKADVKLAIGEGMKPFVTYMVKISIPEEYTQAYAADAGSPVYCFNILKEDWATIANGKFTSTVLWKETLEKTLEYSEYMDLYRFPDLIVEGTNVYFYFNEEEVTEKTEAGTDTTYVKQDFYFTDANGKHITKFSTGYFHPTYGEVSATILEDYDMGYEEFISEETEELVMRFFWPWEITVAAGSFGAAYQYYRVTEWLDTPWDDEDE